MPLAMPDRSIGYTHSCFGKRARSLSQLQYIAASYHVTAMAWLRSSG
jgi:hypothetical protein